MGSSYHPTALAVALATCSGLVLALAVSLTEPQLVVFAAPMLGMVSLGWRTPTERIRVTAAGAEPGRAAQVRCIETDTVAVHLVFAIAPRGAVHMAHPPDVEGLEIEIRAQTSTSLTLRITARRWGRYSIPVEFFAVVGGGLIRLRSRHHVAELVVHPLVVPGTVLVSGTARARRIGRHDSRLRGSGQEFAGIRAFTPGDTLRAVNWPATARRASLHTTERCLQLANDVAVLFDESMSTTGAHPEALDRAVRATAELAWSALGDGDRVGLVCTGAAARWVPTRGGRRQFYGLVDALLDPDDGPAIRFTGSVPPPAAVPAGTTIVAFSTLLESGFALSLIELRKRGYRVVVVDVLSATPFRDDPDPLVARLWSFERAALHRAMGIAGVEVLGWGGSERLAEVIHALPQRSEAPRRSR
ncbi:DUF58 domain-containing protein [Nocardia pseudovaccinii]|uniref:DUF58 domain-containing protein n=1 Tax=Nocardia pseudovaccinii TaxID=189540 RepID=UPI003D9101E3